MRKKIMAVVVVLSIVCGMCAFLCSCAKTDSEPEKESTQRGIFVVIESGIIEHGGFVMQYIMYDPETMVMYTFLDGDRCGGPTVLLNPDGTPRIYSPEG